MPHPTHPTEAEVINAAQKEQKQVEAKQRHLDTLIAKAKKMKVTKAEKNSYNVHSPSGNDYTVTQQPDETLHCTCPFWTYQQDEPTEENPKPDPKPATCSHTIAVAIKRANKEHKELSLTTETTKRTSKHKVVNGDVALLTRKRASK